MLILYTLCMTPLVQYTLFLDLNILGDSWMKEVTSIANRPFGSVVRAPKFHGEVAFVYWLKYAWTTSSSNKKKYLEFMKMRPTSHSHEMRHHQVVRALQRKPTFTSAVKAAAARKRPFGDIVAMLFFNWFVSTVPKSFPLLPCQSLISVPETESDWWLPDIIVQQKPLKRMLQETSLMTQ